MCPKWSIDSGARNPFILKNEGLLYIIKLKIQYLKYCNIASLFIPTIYVHKNELLLIWLKKHADLVINYFSSRVIEAETSNFTLRIEVFVE